MNRKQAEELLNLAERGMKDQEKVLKLIGAALDKWSEKSDMSEQYKSVVIVGALSSAVVAVSALYGIPVQAAIEIISFSAEKIEGVPSEELH